MIFHKKVDEHLNYDDYCTKLRSGTCNDSTVENRHVVSDAIDPSKLANGNQRALNAGLVMGMGLLLVSYFLSNMNGSISKPFIQLYILDVIVNDPIAVMLAYAPAGIFAQLASPKFGKLVDRLNPFVGISLLSSLGALVTFCIISTGNLLVFSLLLVADMAIANTTSLLLSNIFSRVSIKNRGKVLGTGSAFNDLGGAIGPITGGLLWDTYSPQMPFAVSIIIELALIPPYLVALRKLKPHLAEKFETVDIPGMDK